jgi:hypothetical protein
VAQYGQWSPDTDAARADCHGNLNKERGQMWEAGMPPCLALNLLRVRRTNVM